MRLLLSDKPAEPAGQKGAEITPTTAELKKLVEAAMEGSKTAQAKLEEILKELPELRAKVAAIEARLPKSEEPAVEPEPEKKPEEKKPKNWAPWASE